jgi:hypothetical protein
MNVTGGVAVERHLLLHQKLIAVNLFSARLH